MPGTDFARIEPVSFAALARGLSPRRPAPANTGLHIRRAALGVFACRRGLGPGERDRLLGWKRSPAEREDFCRLMAADLAALARAWQPALPPDWLVTTPPPGASVPGPYPAGFLGRAVAGLLGLEYQTTLERSDCKRYHGRHYAMKQAPFVVFRAPAGVTLVIDDLTTSGTTMRLSLEALRAAGVPAFALVWLAND
jgi:hypothetical protein